MDRINGKTAIITGASSGIGRAAAIRFAAEGAKVVGIARSHQPLKELIDDIGQRGGNGIAIAADLTDEREIERVVHATLEQYEGIDVLVNAAGIIASGTIESTKLEDWDYMLNLNLRVPFYLTQCALPSLIERKGCVVNVSSVTGLRSFPGILSYCSSKAALDHFTRCTALETAKYGVRINAVNPGVVRTNLHLQSGMDTAAYSNFLEHSKTTHPLGRVGQPEEVAELILFLASPEASWITGVTVPIDGGRFLTCAR
jgi:NAD(P)-dependent dehydrogenase (short-subunit alcohol dehydrogenase family)